MPMASKRLVVSGESIASLRAALSLRTMGSGVPLGRKTIFQLPASNAPRPCSCAVARSGNNGARTAQQRRRLDLLVTHLRRCAGDDLAVVVDATGDQVLHGGAAAAIGNVNGLDAGR